MDLTADDARALRMSSLLLAPGRPVPGSVADVVEWFGAMQAQDMASGLWSLGARLPAYTLAGVSAAMEARQALRTWPMRGTVHLVPPRDARWMLDLMGVRVERAMATRRAQLGLDDATVTRTMDALGAALAGTRLTRAGTFAALAEAGVDTSGQRGYHLLVHASIRGLICIAPHIGTEQTFALLDDWAPDPHRPERDEALATMALRYFRGHGPTTGKDFAGWTGLTLADARRGIAAAGSELSTVRVDGAPMIAERAALEAYRSQPHSDDLRVLPGFDEYLLGFKDRALMATPEQLAAIVPGNNGVFQSTIVCDGRVVGTWKRTTGARRTVVAVTMFEAVDRARVEAAFAPYAAYLGHPVELRWPT